MREYSIYAIIYGLVAQLAKDSKEARETAEEWLKEVVPSFKKYGIDPTMEFTGTTSSKCKSNTDYQEFKVNFSLSDRIIITACNKTEAAEKVEEWFTTIAIRELTMYGVEVTFEISEIDIVEGVLQ